MGVGVGPAEAGLPALTDVLSGSGFGLRLRSPVSAIFRSLPRAAAAGAAVVVHPGVYRETLTLGPDDSGSPGRPITWRALDGRGAALSGGVEVPRAAFAAVGPSSPLVRADLYAQGVTRSVLCAVAIFESV